MTAPLPPLRYTKSWAYSNMGVLWGTERTRAKAKLEAERISGKPWKEIKRYVEVRKVTIVDGWK
jgi:hypothetical protein